MGIIYKITSPSGRRYVGKTYDLRKRVNAHKCCAKKGSNILLHNSIRKYGWDAHILEVIEEVFDELMDEREMFWINELKTYCYENKMGLNMTKGGEGQRTTWMHDVERRKWYSERFTGSGGPFYGRHHTEENKKAQSERMKQRHKENPTRIPEWGVEKGREIVRKPVICYNSDGSYNSEYKSVTEAANTLNLNPTSISAVCGGNTSQTGGFVFRYKEDGSKTSIEVGEIKSKTVKRPVLTLTPEYEIVCEHPSAAEASEFWGIPKTTINRAAMYNWLVPIRSGHVFIYTDLYNKISTVEAVDEAL